MAMDPFAQLAGGNVRELAERETKRLGEDLERLDEAGWQHPIEPCPGWTAKDLAGHVAFVAEMLGNSVRRSLAGNPGPAWDDFPAARTRIYDAKKSFSNQDQLADFRKHTAEITDTWSKVRTEDFPTAAWHPAGMWTVGRVVTQWLWEVGLHRHDLESSLNPAAKLDPDVAATGVDYLVHALPRWLNPEAEPELNAGFRFVLRDPNRILTIRFNHGSYEITAGTAHDPVDVTFTSDATTWLMATINRVDALQAIADGRIKVEGDRDLAERYWKQLKRV